MCMLGPMTTQTEVPQPPLLVAQTLVGEHEVWSPFNSNPFKQEQLRVPSPVLVQNWAHPPLLDKHRFAATSIKSEGVKQTWRERETVKEAITQ